MERRDKARESDGISLNPHTHTQVVGPIGHWCTNERASERAGEMGKGA